MNRKNMKKFARTMTAYVLVGYMILSAGVTALAASDAEYTKKENVYVTLSDEGKVTGTYVVNNFHVQKEGEITDIGNYDRIQNLTNLDEIVNDDEEHTFMASEGKFYYQGDIEDKELPWLFEIEYRLDGDKIKPEEAAGANGDLEINIHVEENEQADNAIFAKAYLLQISLTLDSKLCKNISAGNASIVDAGENEQITFTVMPGTMADLTVAAEVEDFEMDNISITGVLAATMAADNEPAKEEENTENTDEAENAGNANETENTDENTVGNGVEENSDSSNVESVSSNQGVKIPSFVSEDNKHTEQVMFLMTAEGIRIPEEEIEETVPVKKTFIQKLKDLLNGLSE